MSRRIPSLETERLIIRELTPDDLDAIHGLLNAAFDSDLALEERRRWLQWTVLGYEMFAALDQPHYGERAVVDKATGEVVGAVGIVPYIDRVEGFVGGDPDRVALARAEVGLFWAVAPVHQRKGFATEAARAVVDQLFTRERLGRVIATTGIDNLPSLGVMRSLGMAIERIDPPAPREPFMLGLLRNDARPER